MNVSIMFSIFLGGGLGALSRYGIGNLGTKMFPGLFPAGTMAANFLGCFIIGLLAFLAQNHGGASWKPFAITGFLGALTTFSTFSLESMQLFRSGEIKLALAYVLISNIGGILLAWGGWTLGSKIS